jgi:DNA-binding SARP family transcriptional activator/tetratricopeptide (TPR) repeat protein
MHYRLLGAVGVIGADGQVVALSGERERTLLATLALGGGQPVSVPRLIDALWGEHPPVTAPNTLQVHVSKLRKRLGAAGAGGSLQSVPEGYVLRAGPDEVDATVFAWLVDGATGEPAAVVARLREALSLWRGPALADVRSSLLQGEKTRLEELRLLALERRIDGELALGRHSEVIAELEALVHAHPLREATRRQLMVALYRSERQADALAVYRAGREVLAEELGIDPSPELQALEVAILRQDPELTAPAHRLAAAEPSGFVASVPLPSRLGITPTTGVIGREGELAALTDALKRVSEGNGREVVLITGEPGQGKTTLVSEFARHAHDQSVTVLLGCCDEDVGAPYRPFAESLSHYVSHAPERFLRSHVSDHGGELARMVPALQKRLGNLPPPQSTDPDTERYLLYAAVVALLESASTAAPVVIVLDDLHWADKPSLQLLRHLVANSSTARLVVIGTYRDAELSASHPMTETLAALHRELAGVSSIDLKGLDDTGVIALMEAAAGHSLDDDGVALAHALYRETDGNPFFVAEVLRHLSESGAILQDETGRWTTAGRGDQLVVPDSVRQVIGARVAQVGGTATTVLSTASVIGRDFDLDLLIEVTDAVEDDLIAVLDKAQGAALVQEDPQTPGRYSFRHALIQHTLYEGLGATKRTRAHHQVGEAIERLGGGAPNERVGELARHYLLATRSADAQKAIAYARRAGDSALVALAPDEALRYFSQALELTDQGTVVDPLTRLDLLIGLGTAQRQVGAADFRATLLEAARGASDRGDAGRVVTAALANNRGFFSAVGQVDTDRVEVLEAALEALPGADSPPRARVLSRLCCELTYGPLERRLSLAHEAKAMARRMGDPATLVEVINDCSPALLIPSTLWAQVADGREALAMAESLADPVALFWTAAFLQIEATRVGEFDVAARNLDLTKELSRRVQQPALIWTTSLLECALSLRHGDPEGAEQHATSAFEVGSASGQPDAFAFYGRQLVATRRQQGRGGELVSMFADIAAQNPGVPAFRANLTALQLDVGDHDAARRLTEAAAAEGFVLPMDTAWADGIFHYGRVVIELGLPAPAAQLFGLLAPYHDQVAGTGFTYLGPVATCLGGLATVLGRYDEAERFFAEATELNARGQMCYAEGDTELLWGRMLLARTGPGDAERAHELLEHARADACARGYALLEERASAALANPA